MKQWVFGIILFLLATQPCAQSLTDIDVDDDGLIEIHNLEMLDAMRYQLDGSGYREDVDAVKITAGCAVGGCTGYELMRDLDFMDDASYVSTANKVLWTIADYADSEDTGWQPIGTFFIGTSFRDGFNAIFEGNGHTLSNLRINRSANYIGLFGYTWSSATIVNLGLLDSRVQGYVYVGGLVGRNRGSITNSYATGSVAGEDNVGGLVGVNRNDGSITNSYAMGSVEGRDYVGGLVGWNHSGGSITNSYATGSVEGGRDVGGLVGWNHSGGSITTSYATGSVTGDEWVGGLVGWNHSGGSITTSSATGSVAGRGYVGGLVGENDGSITTSYATGSVTGEYRVGGLVGWNWGGGSITTSYATGSVTGDEDVGGLVGNDNGSITNSYATGSVEGSFRVGGLVGWKNGSITNGYATGSVTGRYRNVGGLVGWNQGRITNGYATGSVAGGNNVGGLVGLNGYYNRGIITTSYATGSVAGRDNVGGLVGLNGYGGPNRGIITNSYAMAPVSGEGDSVGGLVGLNGAGSITVSYWDVQTSGIAVSDGGAGRTTAELQSPITATDIYSSWSSADWDFGESTHYPILNYAVGSDPSGPACGVPKQPVCGTLLPHQIRFLEELLVVNGTLSPLFMPESVDYEVTVAFDTTHLELQTTASGASLHIRSDTLDIAVFGTNTARAVIPLNLGADTVITVTVGSRPTRYRLTVSYASDDTPESSAPVVAVDGTQTISEGDTVTLRATLEGGAVCGIDLRCGWAYVDAASRLVEFATMELSDDLLRLDFKAYTDYVAAEQTTRQLVVVFMVRNRGGLVSVATPLVIMKEDNGPISREEIDLPILIERTLTASIDLTADPDGVSAVPALAYRWQRAQSGVTDLSDPSSWEDINGATGKTYALADRHFTPHRVQISYLDGQAYTNIIYTRWISIRDIDSDDDGLIEIHNLEMLDAMRYQLDGSGYREDVGAAKITTGCADGGCTGYELMRDLDFMSDASYISTANKTLWTIADYANSEDAGWQPIGIYDDFNAIFEGNGYTLSNLMITSDSLGGLFAYTGSNATIVNLGLLNLNLSVRGNSYAGVGGLVGMNEGSITNSYATGSVAGRDYVGGLVGVNEGSITNSYATGSVAGRDYVGGLVGSNGGRNDGFIYEEGSITNSYATGSVAGRGYVGGLVGFNRDSITNSYAMGSVTGDEYVGGLVGRNWSGGSITNSYATGSVEGGVWVGGLVGFNRGSITNSYATGSVEGSFDVGGLVSENEGSITNSYATGSVAGRGYVGGLVGENDGSITTSYATGSVEGRWNIGGLVGLNWDGGSITNSYATGSVIGMGIYVGGLVGWNYGSITNSYATGIIQGDQFVGGLVGQNAFGSVTANYWDVQTSGIAVSAGGTSKTTIELQSPTTATGIYSGWSTADWDFSDPSQYPLLKYAVGTDPDNPACGVSGRPVCGTRLPDQFPERSLLEDLVVVDGTLSPPFNPRLFTYDAMVAVDATHLELQTTAIGASLRIHSDALDTEVRSTDTANIAIQLNEEDDTVIRIEVVKSEYRAEMYRLTVPYLAKPSTPVLVVDSNQAITEGSTATMRVTNAYRCGVDLSCRWSYRDAMNEIELADAEVRADSLQLSFTVPTDYVELGQMTRQLIVSFTASNRSGIASAETALVIMGRSNGSIDEETVTPPTLIDRTFTAPVIDLAADPDGVNADPRLRYQWQRAKSVVVDLDEPANWEDIDGATATTYTLTALSYIPPHRVRVHYTDAQGYENTIYTQWFADIDADDDKLIEIMYLEEVDAMRYQLDGSAYTTSTGATKITTDCADGGCIGYELLRDLDFMDDASYVSTANKTLWTVADYADIEDTGWQPIGTDDDAFNAILEGNGHTLSNLMLNRPAADYIGLFGYTGSSAALVNLGLLTSHVQGRNAVGSLVGYNYGSITNSYATGSVEGEDYVGGLVGENRRRITNSYATGSVTGDEWVGGLVGWNGGSITNSYAAGPVEGGVWVGGLVGGNGGSITNSYAAGSVEGSFGVGGLVGYNEDSITTSYWDVQTSRIAVSAGGTSKTTIDLQSPTTATGIYSGWSTADWDFSSPVHYPLLKYAVGTDPDNPTCGGSEQSACGELLPSQISLLEVLTVANGTVSPPFTPEIFAYDATVASDIAHLELHTTASGALLHIRSDASDTELRSTETASAVLALKPIGDTVIRLTVMEDGKMPTEYRLTVSYTVPPTPVVEGGSMQPLDEGAIVVLRVTGDYPCDSDLILCEWSYRDAMNEIELADAEVSADSLQLSFTVPTDYVELGQTTRQLIVLFTARSRGFVLSAETVLVIVRRSDGSIDEETLDLPTLVAQTFTAPVIDLAADPDGVNADPKLRYQWQSLKSGAVDLDDPDSWEDIDGATSKTYVLLEGAQAIPLRVQIRYTDEQGYENTIYSMPIGDRVVETGVKIRIRVFLEAPL